MIQQPLDAKPARGQHPTVFDAAALRTAIRDAFLKLAPRHIVKSPVMAIVLGGTLLAALITATGNASLGFGWSVTAILLVTVLFGNFAEAVAEARFTEFGIEPYSAFFGAVRNADLFHFVVEIVARPAETATAP